MLKTRIIPVVLMRGGQAVKGEGFDSWRGVGQVQMIARVHDARGVDELVLLEIGGELPDRSVLSALADRCYFPLAVGGGITSVDAARDLLAAGADKVVVNSAAVRDPGLVAALANKLGSQSVCVSIDVKQDLVWIDGGKTPTPYEPVAWARIAASLGAGEILINDIERDGTMRGYNLLLIDAIVQAVDIPVIACGGCADYDDMAHALTLGAHAVAAGALWQFTDYTPPEAAMYLQSRGYNTRVERHGIS